MGNEQGSTLKAQRSSCTLRVETCKLRVESLHQLSDRSQIEIEVLGFETEPAAHVANGLFERHQRFADRFDFFARQRFLLHSPNGLTLHQLAEELDERQYELGDRLLHFLRLGIPSQRSGGTARRGSLFSHGNWAGRVDPPLELAAQRAQL